MPAARSAATRILPLGLALAGVLAAASLATQVYWFATGDNLGLGLVPAFNPAGVGNLPVFAITAVLACCAAWIGVLAAALRLHGERGWLAWALLAVAAAGLSLQRLTVPRPRLGGDPGWFALGYTAPPPLSERDLLIGAASAAALGIAAWAWRYAGAGRAHLAVGTACFAAGTVIDAVAGGVTAAAWPEPRLAPALLTVGARALEIAGVALVADAAARHLASVAPGVRVEVDGDAERALDARRLPGGIEVRIGPRRLARLLFAAIGVLIAASLLTGWAHARWPETHRLYRLSYVDFETNVPTWWSAMLLLSSGAAAALAGVRSLRAIGGRWVDWLTLAALFVALAADEAASLHELLQKPVRALLGSETWLRYPLIVPGGLFALALALRFRRFMRTLGPTRRRLTVGAAVYALGALGVEAMGGWFAPEVIGPNATYLALTTIEEALEMIGATLVLLALLRHLGRYADLQDHPARAV